MRYVFFDIECADGCFRICEFGYVITDEQFNVLTKNNILINPKCKFHLTGRDGQKDLILSYPEEEYLKHKPFRDMYDNIKYLMTQKDIMIFGHAVDNDISFLNSCCNFYKVEPFDYVTYDIQKMLPVFSRANKQYTALEKAFVEIVPDEERANLIAHRAADDAYETMLVLKHMTRQLQFSVPEIIDSCPGCRIQAFQCVEKKKEKNREKQLKKQLKARIRKANEYLLPFYAECKDSSDNDGCIGKFVSISLELKLSQESLGKVVALVRSSSFLLVNNSYDSDFLIAKDEEEIGSLKEKMRKPYSGKIITITEFEDMVSRK